MNEYYRRIYDLVAQIPEGRVTTYGCIAALLGRPRGARTVGWAMRSAPAALRLPCHRVVNKKGELAPSHAFGGPGHQRARLETEGVTFSGDGCVDLQRHFWPGLNGTKREY